MKDKDLVERLLRENEVLRNDRTVKGQWNYPCVLRLSFFILKGNAKKDAICNIMSSPIYLIFWVLE